VEEIWESLKKGVKECENKREVKIREQRLSKHSWWDATCKRKKRNVYKAYIKKGKQGKLEYLCLRREFSEKCKEKEERNRKIEKDRGRNHKSSEKNITTEAQI